MLNLGAITSFASSLDDYLVQRTIGQGTFGRVKLGIHRVTSEKVAIKSIHKNKFSTEKEMENCKRELGILKKVSHPNIVRLYEIIQTENEYLIIMEYVETDLMSHIIDVDRIQEHEAALLTVQILSAVQYLHSNRICHRDIKPGNILLTADRKAIKLTDFGLSRPFSEGQLLDSYCGSPCYVAPEVLYKRKYNPQLLDVWSIGITLYMMLSGYLPFDDKNMNKLYRKIMQIKYDIPTTMSKLTSDLIKKILLPANLRISIKEFKKHPWILLHSVKRVQAVRQSEQSSDVNHKLTLKLMSLSGIPPQVVVQNLQSKLQNKITTLYFLYLKKGKQELEKLVQLSGKKTNSNQKTRAYSPRKLIRRTIQRSQRSVSKHRPSKSIHNIHRNQINTEASVEKYTKIDLNTRGLSKPKITYKESSQIYVMDASLRTRRQMRNLFLKDSNANIKDIQCYYGPFSLQSIVRLPPFRIRAQILRYLQTQGIPTTQLMPWKIQCEMGSRSLKIVINQLNSIQNTYVVRFVGQGPQLLYKQILSSIAN